MRKLLAYIFIFIFSFQALPVKAISKLLCKGQGTEQVQDDGSDDDAGKIKKDADEFLYVAPHTSSYSLALQYNNKINTAIHRASILPDHFTPDIPTPPPDRN